MEMVQYQEAVEESIDELGGVVDALGVLSDDPDHGCPRLGLVQRFEVVAERGDGALVPVGGITTISLIQRHTVQFANDSRELSPVGILPEDVFEYDGGLLHHVAHPAAEIPEL